jgi:hypothetical protein
VAIATSLRCSEIIQASLSVSCAPRPPNLKVLIPSRVINKRLPIETGSLLLAEREGFEPSEELPPHPLSKRAH